MRYLLTIISFLCIHGAYAQHKINGYVRSNGQGIEGVVVNVGLQSTLTNAKGYFQLSTFQDDKFVQISTPAGYVPENNGSIPLYYLTLSQGKHQYNFNLVKLKTSDLKHKIIVQTDVQVANEDDISQYQKSIIPDIISTIANDGKDHWFGIDLGDMVGDDPKLMPKYEYVMRNVNLPFYRLIGNHDMAYWGRTHETSEKHFNNNFGPTNYSFNKGNVHYIAINNNFYVGRDYFYMGYIDEKTFKWLEQDLAHVDKSKTIFLMMHIPSRLEVSKPAFSYNYSFLGGNTINADVLYELIKEYKVHILSGHTHQNLNIVHNNNLIEHNIAAASGSWWDLSLCTDGTPRGYRVFHIDGDDVRWYYKSQGYPKEYQSRSYIDSTGMLISNVWNYDDKWKVEWYEDNKYMGELKQFTGQDQYVVELCKDRSKIRYGWIAASNSKHLFKTELTNSKSQVHVKITDRFGIEYIEKLK